ncbi:MAG: galactonate dehydratase, partial [Actinobacteria bacterium]|nr:galactonate dehydratase [Actinomycetota bacterium]
MLGRAPDGLAAPGGAVLRSLVRFTPPYRMRITGIRVVHLGAPSTPDFRLNRNWAFVLVETDKGLAGTGECTLLGMQDAVDGAISQFATFLTGQDPRRVEHLWQQMYRHPFWRGGPVLSAALSGVDQALWDLAGQALG